MKKLKFGVYTLFSVVLGVCLSGQVALAAEKTGSEIQVPTCITGFIITLDPISLCNDGVTHLLNNSIVPIRLKARTEEVKKAFDKFAGTTTKVSVCGNLVAGVENPACNHLTVYSVSPLMTGAKFRVMALTVSLPGYQGCRIIPENGFDITIYSSVYGPATEAECLDWIAKNCGK